MSLMAQVDRARSTLQAANEQLSEARELLGLPKQEAPKEPEEKGLFDRVKDAVSNVSLSDVGHTVLDIAGLVPVLGAPADGINAVWYAAEGDWVNAGLSAAGMIPFAGEAATAAKLGNRAVDAVRTADNAIDAARGADNAIDAARVTDNADEFYMHGQPVPPMERTLDHALNSEQYLYDVAQRHGINLRGSGQPIQIVYDESLDMGSGKLGRTIESEGGRLIRIGPGALTDEATAANTIAHELSHARDYLRGDIHKPHGDNLSLADDTAYGSGNALEDYIKGNR